MFNYIDNEDLKKILFRYKMKNNLDPNSPLPTRYLDSFIGLLAEQIRIIETGDKYGKS